jgi:hypothetical protein
MSFGTGLDKHSAKLYNSALQKAHMEFLPVLELIDRLCIARVKHARTQGANQIELDWYEDKYRQLPQSPELDADIQAMTDIHHAIWDLEWQLKSGVEQMLSLQEIGRRAIAIRDFNNRRIVYKNSIATILGHPVREIKQDHLADGTVATK